MVDSDQDQKTEPASGKKLAKAREEGQLPISREVGSWFQFAGILLVIGIFTPMLGTNLLKNLRIFLEMPHQLRIGDHGLQNLLTATLISIGLPVLLIFIVLLAAAVFGTQIQTGFFATTKPLEFDWERLNPTKGFKNLFSKGSLVELGKGFIKIGIVGYLSYILMRPYVDKIDLMIGRDMGEIGESLQEEAFGLLLSLMFVISLIALIDLVYKRYVYFKSLRMTKQEVKDEMKQSEGDPMIKMRIRQIRMEKARKRMMTAVPNADVVLTNPTHYAVALKYDTAKMNAPTVVAKGADLIALRIRKLAEEANVPIMENPPLARALYQSVEVDQEITPEHYRAVAEIISYIFRLKKAKLH